MSLPTPRDTDYEEFIGIKCAHCKDVVETGTDNQMLVMAKHLEACDEYNARDWLVVLAPWPNSSERVFRLYKATHEEQVRAALKKSFETGREMQMEVLNVEPLQDLDHMLSFLEYRGVTL